MTNYAPPRSPKTTSNIKTKSAIGNVDISSTTVESLRADSASATRPRLRPQNAEKKPRRRRALLRFVFIPPTRLALYRWSLSRDARLQAPSRLSPEPVAPTVPSPRSARHDKVPRPTYSKSETYSYSLLAIALSPHAERVVQSNPIMSDLYIFFCPCYRAVNKRGRFFR